MAKKNSHQLSPEAEERIKPLVEKLSKIHARAAFGANVDPGEAYYGDPLIVQGYILPGGNLVIVTVHAKTGSWDIYSGCPFGKIENALAFLDAASKRPVERVKDIRHELCEKLQQEGGITVNGGVDCIIDQVLRKHLGGGNE